MLTGILVFSGALFVLAAACYLLFITSEPLERVGGRLGHLLRLPEDVIASTFQALATSGPEIVMAIVAATPFILSREWGALTLGERACSGALNMSFSAMDNLLGIGCLGMIFMLRRGTVKKEEVIVVEPSVKIGLIFYILASLCLCLFIQTSFAKVAIEGKGVLWASTITEVQAWVLMIIGICFIISQFFVPNLIARRRNQRAAEAETQAKAVVAAEGGENATADEEEDEDEEPPLPVSLGGWVKDFVGNGFIYAFLIFALVIFVRACLAATFNMALVGLVSVGGVLIMFTSYVSSFPEFMMTFRYAIANKKSALLGMLFGSNVIDLAFVGFRAMYRHEPMQVFTTGRIQWLYPAYLWTLPVIAVLSLIGIWSGKLKYKHAYPLVVFYIAYIVSGFILL